MKSNSLLLVIGLCLALISTRCDSGTFEPKLSQSELDELHNEIVAQSMSLDCTNSSDWSFTEIGDKPCGGPAGYIAYSLQIDTVAFLAKVEAYTLAHRKYNIENGIISNCALEPTPIGVKCQEKEPVLIYGRCELPPDSGPCEAAIPKYYFDQEEQKCKEFLWGGCEGLIPFDTLEECKECE